MQGTFRQEGEAEGDAEPEWHHHAAEGDRHRRGRALKDLARLHLQPGEQHQEEHAEVGDGVEHLVAGEAGERREGGGEGDDHGAERDAGDQLADQRGLRQTLRHFAESAGGDEQDEKYVEKVHANFPTPVNPSA